MKHTFLVSDETVNSHGFRIITEGINTARFEKNPIMLYMHDTPTIIGRWENLQKKNGQFFADAVFDESDVFAKEVMGKVERGFLKATSLGISHSPTALQKDDKGNYLSECELYEISIVAIPSNGNAVKLYTEKYETVQLKLHQLSEVNSLPDLLKLNASQNNPTAVLNAVKALVLENETLKLQAEIFKSNQEAEIKLRITSKVGQAILKGQIGANQKQEMISLGITSEKALDTVISAIPEKRNFSLGLKVPTGLELTDFNKKDDLQKPKSDWNLEDYRMHAPKELEADPELFKRLISAEYHN